MAPSLEAANSDEGAPSMRIEEEAAFHYQRRQPTLDIGYLEPEDTLMLAKETQFHAYRTGRAAAPVIGLKPRERMDLMRGSGLLQESFEYHVAMQSYHQCQLEEESHMLTAVKHMGEGYRATKHAKQLVSEVSALDHEWKVRQTISEPKRASEGGEAVRTSTSRTSAPDVTEIEKESPRRLERESSIPWHPSGASMTRPVSNGPEMERESPTKRLERELSIPWHPGGSSMTRSVSDALSTERESPRKLDRDSSRKIERESSIPWLPYGSSIYQAPPPFEQKSAGLISNATASSSTISSLVAGGRGNATLGPALPNIAALRVSERRPINKPMSSPNIMLSSSGKGERPSAPLQKVNLELNLPGDPRHQRGR